MILPVYQKITTLLSQSILVALLSFSKFAEINVTFLVSLFGIFQSRGSVLKMCSATSK